MAYTVNWEPTNNFTPGSQTRAAFGRGRTTEIIVGHWWGDPNTKPSYSGVVAWFKNPKSQVSAHYVVGQGKMCQMVDEDDTAWHARQANPFSIGIEFNPNPTDEDYDRMGWLVYDIRRRLGKLPLKRHSDYVQTQCPGSTDLDRINRIADAYANPAPVVPEWLKNKKAITPVQLKVVVPQAQIYDLRDSKAIKPLAYATPVDFVAMTTVGGKEYYISSYSNANGLPNGMLKSDMGVIAAPPVVTPPPPVATIPDYADDAIDTPDVKMYAQVDTALFNFETGKTETTYKRGQEFDISAKTTYLGKPYYITVYSYGKKIWKGLPAIDLAATPPPTETPGVPVTDIVAIKGWFGEILVLIEKIKAALGIK